MANLPVSLKRKQLLPFLGLGFLILTLGILTVVVQKTAEWYKLKEKAAAEDYVSVLELSAVGKEGNSFSAKPGENFQVNLKLIPNQALSAVDVVLDFNNDLLTLTDISENTGGNLKTFTPIDAAGSFDKSTVIATANDPATGGVIEFGAVSFDYTSEQTTDPQGLELDPLATLTFEVKEDATGEAKIEFGEQGFIALGDTTDSNAVKYVGAGSDKIVADVLARPETQVLAMVLSSSSTDISLVKGHNLISLPLEPADARVEIVLEPILESLEIMYSLVPDYDRGTSLWHQVTSGELLTPGKGYNIKMNEDATLPLSGTTFEYPEISLKADYWYLIGAPPESTKLYAMLGTCDPEKLELNGIYADYYVGHEYFDIELNQDTLIESKKGYFIKSSVDCVFGSCPSQKPPDPCPGSTLCLILDCYGVGFGDDDWSTGKQCYQYNYVEEGDCVIDIADIQYCAGLAPDPGTEGAHCSSDDECDPGLKCDICHVDAQQHKFGECVSPECPESSSTCENPDGSVYCGQSISGCLYKTDRKYYRVPDAADFQSVTVTLTYSESDCYDNDLFIYDDSCLCIGGDEGDVVDTWSGTPSTPIIIDIDGDSSNPNCQWTLEVSCARAITLPIKVSFEAISESATSVSDVKVKVGSSEFTGTFSRSDGSFSSTITLEGISPGTYDVVVKGPLHLSRKVASLEIVSGPNPELDLTGKSLLGGDLDGNDKVDLDDAIILGNNYDTGSAEADMTFDGWVNVDDAIILGNNYGEAGEE